MNNILKNIGLVIVGAVVGGLLAASFGSVVPSVGGVYSQSEKTFGQGIAVGTARQFVVSSTGALTTSGAISSASIASTGAVSGTTGTFSGDVSVTTSNTATSSIEVGCIQQYATSTATAWKFVIVASSTQIATGYNGLVYAKYGTCP